MNLRLVLWFLMAVAVALVACESDDGDRLFGREAVADDDDPCPPGYTPHSDECGLCAQTYCCSELNACFDDSDLTCNQIHDCIENYCQSDGLGCIYENCASDGYGLDLYCSMSECLKYNCPDCPVASCY